MPEKKIVGDEAMRAVAAKVLAVMEDVSGVVKDGLNTAQNYPYASSTAVVGKIREAMIKHKLVAIPIHEKPEIQVKDKGEKFGWLTTISIQYLLIDVDTGHSITVRTTGQGYDATDKGVYKAATGAEKYLLLKTFLIPTSENDPENEETPKHAPAKPASAPSFPRPPTPPMSTPPQKPEVSKDAKSDLQEAFEHIETLWNEVAEKAGDDVADSLLLECSGFTGKDGKEVKGFDSIIKLAELVKKGKLKKAGWLWATHSRMEEQVHPKNEEGEEQTPEEALGLAKDDGVPF